MTDPERIGRRPTGLAAELLRAGAAEQPGRAGMESTLAALGVSAAILSSTTTASAAVAGAAKTAGTSAGSAVKAVSATLLAKWIGIGVVSGVGLAGAAAFVATPSHVTATVSPSAAARLPPIAAAKAPEPAVPATETVTTVAEPVAPSVAVAPLVALHGSSAPLEAAPSAIEVGAPLAAEVAHVDRARALLAAGNSEAGLALLASYEREFPEARLLPEVLFMQLEAYSRSGRSAEARRAAQRLLDGFPKSPHASRARKVLAP